MASNELPKGLDELFTLAEDMADGLQQDALNATPIDIKQNTEAIIRAVLATGISTHNAYTLGRGQKKTLNNTVLIADSNGRAFIGVTRDVLKPTLGQEWNDAWLPTGFPNQSLAIPETVAERQSLLQSLNAYFADPAHASQENAPLNITAARALLLFNALSTARSALNTHLVLLGTRQAARNAAIRALRTRMTGLVDELGQLIPDDDPRWLGFGLNMPAAPDTPESPDAPVLTQVDADSVLIDWGDMPRATRYRVWMQILGTDANFIAVATVQDSDATLDNLPAGATIRIRITAANDTGESPPSPSAEITLAA